MVAKRIKVNKEIYKWAVLESQKNIEEVINKFKNFEKWLNEEEYPTFRQVEELANFFKVPLGYMFLNKPPESILIDSEFRTIKNKRNNISKNLKDTIFLMSRKQDWLSEYRKNNGWEKIFNTDFKDTDIQDVKFLAREGKKLLEIEYEWFNSVNNYKEAFNFLRNKLEYKGIIVMQNGIVGFNTRRKLDVEEFRGFMLYDDYSPFIFINGNDSDAGKIFTLIHEYIHILFEEDDLFGDIKVDTYNQLETRINKVVAEFLMPEEIIIKHFNINEKSIEAITRLSKIFKVSKIALAIRLYNLNLIEYSLLEKVKNHTIKNIQDREKKSRGGHYWNAYKSKYSKSFRDAVIYGAEAGDISYNYAFSLLDIKAKNYDLLKEETYV